jgi:hypothetical protein
MKQWTNSIRLFENVKNKPNIDFFLLELDTIQENLIISTYSKREKKFW